MTPIIVRTYKGRTQAKAAEAFAKDANAAEGYAPVSQSWAPPKFGTAGGLMVLAGFFAIVGFLVGPAMLAVAFVFLCLGVITPDSQGELTVTYSRT